MTEEQKLDALNKLIAKWREPGVHAIRPCDVVPDTTNRENTGLSVVHCHYLATLMESEGFHKRDGQRGHDIPVLVKESAQSELGSESLQRWREASSVEGFASCPVSDAASTVFYTSLGNGHFFQARTC